MLIGRVMGSVWATKRLDEIPHGALLDVETDGGDRLVVFDVLGTGIGEWVLVVTGSVASRHLGESQPPIDALIIGSVDEPTDNRATGTAAKPRTRRSSDRARRTQTRRKQP
jgi:ethanolamine utilization protein EutN